MRELDDITVHRKAVLKAWRSMIRLKHSLAADAEINTTLPAAEKAFNARLSRGELASASEIFTDIVEAPDATADL